MLEENMFSKKCDICGIQPAVLFFRTLNTDSKNIQEEGLCPKCALQRFSEGNNSELENQDIIHTINQMKNVLSDIVGHISQIEQNPNISQCRHCKTTIKSFKQNTSVGCSYCYQEFSEQIQNHLTPLRFGAKHKGQIPQRYKTLYFAQLELEKLKLKLQTSLRTENYEEAIKLQKRISKLQSKPHHN